MGLALEASCLQCPELGKNGQGARTDIWGFLRSLSKSEKVCVCVYWGLKGSG